MGIAQLFYSKCPMPCFCYNSYMKPAVIALWLAAAVFAFGCTKEVKEPSDDSNLAVEAVKVMESLKEAYERKDFESLKKYTTNDGYNSIKKDIKDFEKAEIALQPKRVEIDDDIVRVNLTWDGRWRVEGQTSGDHGMAVFVFIERPLRLQSIELSNPFGKP